MDWVDQDDGLSDMKSEIFKEKIKTINISKWLKCQIGGFGSVVKRILLLTLTNVLFSKEK